MSDRQNDLEQARRGRELTIIKGQELELHVSGDVLAPREFMHAAYRQALAALVEIIRHTERFEEQLKCRKGESLEMKLFPYSGNVIAFAGQRGAGKTRTMLSFSRFLACPGDDLPDSLDLKKVRECRFFVMPPISPSALKESSEFLYVVLSRLYRYVSRELEESSSCLREDPGLRTELWRYFNRCVSGINGLSAGDGKAADISELQDTVDGLVLRESFYKIVSTAVNRVLEKDCKQTAFLVLQLDDADSQIENGYQVLEDVRRYLLIPNLIILMSSDMETLHNVVLQNHMQQFPDLLKADAVSLGSLSRTCRKYIDKLIPPSHMIHLPRLEQYADLGGADIQLRYVDEKGKPALDWAGDMPSQKLQDMVLAIIYKKTGIIFVSQDSPMNYIIPRSLRGLNQFLYLLSEMEDIPEINPSDWNSPQAVAAAVLEQYPTAFRNLEWFRNYFFYDWLDVKIRDKKDRLFLRELVNAPRANFIREIQGYLRTKYKDTEKAKDIGDEDWTLSDMDLAILRWKRSSLSAEEDLLFFVIGAIRTIRGHMAAWKIKRDTANIWLSPDEGRERRLFACDYDPESWQITARYPLFGPWKATHEEYLKYLQMGETYNGNPIYLATIGKAAEAVIKDWNDRFPASKDSSDQRYLRRLCSEVFTRTSQDPDTWVTITPLQFITLFLRLGEPVKDGYISEQRFVYLVQESALRVALNWEVTEKVYLEVSSGIGEKNFEFDKNSFVESLANLFYRIDGMLEKLNSRTVSILWKQQVNNTYGFGDMVWSLFSARRLGELSTYMRREMDMCHKRDETPVIAPDSDSARKPPAFRIILDNPKDAAKGNSGNFWISPEPDDKPGSEPDSKPEDKPGDGPGEKE